MSKARNFQNDPRPAQAVSALGLTSIAKKERLCPQCQQFRPTAAFEMAGLDPRCNVCITPEQAKSLVGEPAAVMKYHLNKLFASTGCVAEKNQASAARLETVLGLLIVECGGMETFAGMMAANVKEAMVERCGSPAAIKTMMGLLGLLRDVDKHRLEQDVKLMTTEQIQEELVRSSYEAFAKMIADGGANASETAATLRAICDQLDPQHNIIDAVPAPAEGSAA